MGFGRGRGRGFGRGGRGREFDRRSGSNQSGVKAVDKKDGAGSSNWCTVEDDLEGQTGEVKPAEDVVEGNESDETEQMEQQVSEIAEQSKEMTLDEWKKSQAHE